MLPGQAGGGLDGGHDDPQHVHRPAQRLAIAGKPGLLQPAKRDGRRGVAGQDHQIAACAEQGLAAGLGEPDDLFARPPAIGDVGLVAQEHEVGRGEPVHQGAVDGQPAHAGIEHADHHDRRLARPRPGVHAAETAVCLSLLDTA